MALQPGGRLRRTAALGRCRAHAPWLLAAILLAPMGACGETQREDDAGGAGGGGPGGSPSAGGAGSGGSTTSSSDGGAGLAPTCDDLGFCGQPEDPGCVACAITTGSCVDEYEACDAECEALRMCYVDCDTGDAECLDDCDAAYPGGIGPLNTLFGCILCEECPVSCNFDTTNCP
jgi:hypothetical protein